MLDYLAKNNPETVYVTIQQEYNRQMNANADDYIDINDAIQVVIDNPEKIIAATQRILLDAISNGKYRFRRAVV